MIELLFWENMLIYSITTYQKPGQTSLKTKKTTKNVQTFFFGGGRSVSCTFAHHSSCSARPSKNPLEPRQTRVFTLGQVVWSQTYRIFLRQPIHRVCHNHLKQP